MSQIIIAWLRLVLVITMVFAGVYGADQSGASRDAIIDGVIPAGTIEERDAIVAGDVVTIDGDVNGDLLILAMDATINGNVDGSVITTARTVEVGGQIKGSIYTVGRSLVLAEGASVGRSVYFLGLHLVTEKGSGITWDLSVISLRARLRGDIGRDLKAIIGLFELLGQFTGEEDAVPSSESGFLERLGHFTRGAALHAVGGAVYQPFWPFMIDHAENTQSSSSQQADLQGWAQNAFQEFFLLLLTGLFMVWRYPARLSAWTDKVKTRPFPALGYGFIGFVVAINVFILANIVMVLLLVAGFWLGFSSLWKLAFVFWLLGFSVLGLATTSFYLFVFYGSKAIVAYLFSLWTFGRFSGDAARHRYLLMFAGLLIYVLLQSLPYVGWLINILAVMAGVGAAWLAHRSRRDEKLVLAASAESE
ncbi:MAG TPA: polymer-forming cytoskeletal protein [Anaerolineales bacterium]|nr:polymer-forming cytoskeletal protein [Anaerolineales bacterium]